MSTDILTIQNLVVRYGNIEALHGISLSIPAGKIVTLIGANGAGKTTLLRAISGLIPATSGTITYTPPPKNTQSAVLSPQSLSRLPAHKIVAAGISHVPEGRGIFPQMTVLENLTLGAYLRTDDPTQDRDHAFDLFPRLKERRTQLAGTLSGGEQQMLAIARALMARPTLLLLDEPSLGLAPLLVQHIFDTIKRINAQGTTILLVEQNANLALATANYAYVLETGTILLHGPSHEIATNPQVRAAYLGAD